MLGEHVDGAFDPVVAVELCACPAFGCHWSNSLRFVRGFHPYYCLTSIFPYGTVRKFHTVGYGLLSDAGRVMSNARKASSSAVLPGQRNDIIDPGSFVANRSLHRSH